MSLAALRSDQTIGKTMTLAGPKAWTVQEVIELCEKLANAEADVTQVPVWLLKATRGFLRSFQWARDAADRLVPISSLHRPFLALSVPPACQQIVLLFSEQVMIGIPFKPLLTECC